MMLASGIELLGTGDRQLLSHLTGSPGHPSSENMGYPIKPSLDRKLQQIISATITEVKQGTTAKGIPKWLPLPCTPTPKA